MTAVEDRLATVTPLHVGPHDGTLPYRWGTWWRAFRETGHDIHRRMLAVEDQAAAVWREADGDVDEACALLDALGSMLTRGQVERLFTLSQEASDAEMGCGVCAQQAREAYEDFLQHLACVVRDRAAVSS